MRLSAFACAFCLCAHISSACAEGDEVVVSATRSARPSSAVGSSVAVIDAADIEARQYRFVTEALRDAVGASIAQNGAAGAFASARIRGASSGQTLVLIDGVVVNDPSAPSGGYNFANLDVADIERIEILRGPQGILYGADAIGGVIFISTRQEGAPLSLSLEGGSFGTARGAASLVAGGETARLRATVSGVRTDGISRAASGVEADGYRSIAASFYGALEPGEVWRGSVSARFSDSLAEIDGFPPPFFALADTEETEATREFSAAARAEHDTGAFRGGFTLAFSRIDRLNEDAGAVLFDALGERWTLDYLGSVDIDERVALSAGAEIERTSMDASGIDSSADSAAVFALLEARPTPNVSLSAGLRRDEFSDFAGATTARLAGAWTTPTGGVLRASWGEGFRAPSLFELNFNLFGLPPNPDLSPERANGFDVGYEQPLFDDRLRLRATYFNLRIRDQIDFDFGTGGFVNIDRVRSRGVEAEGEFSPASFVELSLAYTFTDAIDKATQLPLLRIPKHKGTLVATVRPTGKLALSATVYGNGKERDTGGAVNEAFVRLDLRAAYDLNERAQLFARIENATDTDYQDVAGFGEPGAAVYAGIRAHL